MQNQRIAGSFKLLTSGTKSWKIVGFYLIFRQPTRAREKHYQILWYRLLYNEPNKHYKTLVLIVVSEFVIRL